MKTVAFVPIRLNSKRVIRKNLRLLGEKPLMCYILESLCDSKNIDEIYVYCSSEEIIEYLPEKVMFLKRNEYLDRDETLGKEIYESFIDKVKSDVYILSHTTSPFMRTSTIENALNKVLTEGYDSAFSAEKIQTFAWYQKEPLNYNLKEIPRTQTIEPIYIETSGFYIFMHDIWKIHHQRIGLNPYIAIVNSIEGIDIDNPEDFEFAEKIFAASNI
jgi:CMP-N-acetylneuraminic acid synthetase